MTTLAATSSGDGRSAAWVGTASGAAGESLRAIQTFAFNSWGCTLRIHVQLTNTGSQTLPGVKYLRALNPDPDLALGGNALSANAVWMQPGSTSTDMALAVSTSGLGLVFGMASADARAMASVEGSLPLDPDDVLASPNAPGPDAPSNGDEALAIALMLGDLSPGETASFELAYTTDADGLDMVVADLAAVRIVAPTGAVSPGSAPLLAAIRGEETRWVSLYQNGSLLAVDGEPDVGGVFGVAFEPSGDANGLATLDAVAFLDAGQTVTERISIVVAGAGAPIAFSTPTTGQSVAEGRLVRVLAVQPGNEPVRIDLFADSPSAHLVLGSCTSVPCEAGLSGLAADETTALSARSVDA